MQSAEETFGRQSLFVLAWT